MATVLIIGASRGIGLEAVKAALAAGHSVRALARSARRIRLDHPKLEKNGRRRARARHGEAFARSNDVRERGNPSHAQVSSHLAHEEKRKPRQKPAKSRAWLDAECLKLARTALGGSEIQLVTIRLLHPKGMGPQWKVADIIPEPTPLVSEHVRAALAHLTGAYSLEEE
jgi:NAD(P)-dependent dehydrogenase (short-subunit alcohol dehydrogenase family)